VARDSGSSPSAYFLVLEELLRRGVGIDFHGIRGWGIPAELVGRPGFRLTEYELPFADRVVNWLIRRRSPLLRVGGGFAWNAVRVAWYGRRLAAGIRRRHARRPYSAVLCVDRLSEFPPWADLPTVSWPQGCPPAELDPVRRLRRQVVGLCGWRFYLAFHAYYLYRTATARRLLPGSRRILCGSRMSAGYWRRLGARADRVVPLPYCVDLGRFAPPPAPPPLSQPFTFLHLGRIVPRKRPDLLLEGFQLLRQTDPDVRLLVVGEVQAASGYGRLLADPRLTAGVEFPGRVPRAEVPALFGRVGGLVQPSETENFGTAVMEALACGLPVAVGPTNGTADYVSPRSVVFAGYTPRAVADGMAELKRRCLADWPGMRAEARAAAETHFAVGRVADQVLAVVAAARRG
jgi:glycosyltransferase involved in cell wall biosynthesis